MKILARLTALLLPRTAALPAEPFCVQEGDLRAYIWPLKDQYSYEVVTAAGEKIGVGVQRDLTGARDQVLRRMDRLRKQS
jgi:hypothetical protein